MWKIWNKVTEVLAPTVHTTMDEIKEQWWSIRAFYIDKKQNVENSTIPQNINRMIQLLLEEEDDIIAKNNANTHTGGTGPCLDFFLREKILQFLCEVCLKDIPKGMRKITLAGITTLLRNMKSQPLITHQSIHHPLSNLVITYYSTFINKSNIVASSSPESDHREDDEDMLALIDTIITKLLDFPSCFQLFFSPHINTNQNNEISNHNIDNKDGNNDDNCNGNGDGDDNECFSSYHHQPIAIMEILLYYLREKEHRIRSEVALIKSLQLHPRVSFYLLHSSFSYFMVERANEEWSFFLSSLHSQNISSALHYFRFVSQLLQTQHIDELHRDIEEKLADYFFKTQLFIRYDSSSNSEEVVEASIFFNSFLHEISSSSRSSFRYFVNLFFYGDGNCSNNNNDGGDDDHRRYRLFFSRLSLPSSPENNSVINMTWQIAKTMIYSNDEFVISLLLSPSTNKNNNGDNLQLSNIEIDDKLITLHHSNRVINWILNAIPRVENVSWENVEGFNDYVVEAHIASTYFLSNHVSFTAHFSAFCHLPNSDVENNNNNISVNDNKDEADHFISVLMRRFESFADLPSGLALLIADLFTRSIYFPSFRLSLFAYHSSPFPLSFIPAVGKKISASANVDNFETKAQQLKYSLSHHAISSLNLNREEEEIMNYIIFAEFCKQLAAIIYSMNIEIHSAKLASKH